ncbi:hypothetical protein HYH03_016642 [Edaphochlamys debaryana]|uniref:Uncharacterized protein n=1 Tax=Edaphochlamys debaryana TaxID=47281 RepID=A0A836BPR2_9CHLO|nr:hypothetical protein HYH03_016642 [Edaphochlamys debaryana]|eukprot:KAG2484601.1 hypothetical protein HYH03_016642 [Edaphochlamys debaryana]
MRQSQRRSTDLLALLLDSRDPAATARENLGALSEEFFMTAGTFLTLARKEGNADVATRLERALMAAWDVKQSSLRPELQLLNRLVRAGGEPERRQIYLEGGPSLPPLLSSDGRWFFRTLERLTGDVERQPPNPDKVPLLSKLKAIAREAEAIEKQATKKGFGNGNGNGNGKKA